MDIDDDQPHWTQVLLNQFQLQLQAALAQTFQQLAPVQPPVIDAPAPISNAFLALPQFTGDVDDVEPFIQQVSDALVLLSGDFQSERQRVIFVASHFEDAALDWYHGLQDANSPCLNSLDAFASAIRSRFGDPDPSFTAYQKLKTIQQTGTVSDYNDEFNRLLKRVNVTVQTAMDFYYEGLCSEVLKAMIGRPKPISFPHLQQMALDIDYDRYRFRPSNSA